jgi:hypothetical protein
MARPPNPNGRAAHRWPGLHTRAHKTYLLCQEGWVHVGLGFCKAAIAVWDVPCGVSPPGPPRPGGACHGHVPRSGPGCGPSLRGALWAARSTSGRATPRSRSSGTKRTTCSARRGGCTSAQAHPLHPPLAAPAICRTRHPLFAAPAACRIRPGLGWSVWAPRPGRCGQG